MRLYIRLFTVALSALLGKKAAPFSGESVLRFTVMPWDCVIRLMGNDRYHAFMDLGRVDLLVRLGAWDMVIRDRLQPFVSTVHIRHQYRLRMFQKFMLRTRLVHADKKFFLIEHIFQIGKKIMAAALSKNGFTHRGKIVDTTSILQATNWQRGSCDHESVSVMEAMGKLLIHLHHANKSSD